jgi:hypothetical protein
MADKKFNIKDQLAGIAALIAAIVAIGGGFVKYGEVMTKLEVLEGASKSIDMSFLSEIKVLEEKVAKLESKKQVIIDTSAIESSIAVLEEKVEVLENQEEVDISGLESGLAQYKTKSLVNSKEIELLKVQIEEIKVSTSNPLAN